MTPKLGLTFEAAAWLDERNNPLIMRITKIARGMVYYRTIDGFHPTSCRLEDFSRHARPASSNHAA